MSSIQLGPEDLPDVGPDNHGRTLAGWFLMVGLVAAALMVAFGMTMAVEPLIWAGIIVTVVSLIGSAVLRMLGYGQPRRR